MTSPTPIQNTTLTDKVFFDDGVVKLTYQESLNLLAIKESLPPELASLDQWEIVATFMAKAAEDIVDNLPMSYQDVDTDGGGTLFSSLTAAKKVKFFLEDISKALEKFDGATNPFPQTFDDFVTALNANLTDPDTLSTTNTTIIQDFFQGLFEISIGVREFDGTYPFGTIINVFGQIKPGDFGILDNLPPPTDLETFFAGNASSNITGFFQEFAREYPYGDKGIKNSGDAEATFMHLGETINGQGLFNFLLNYFDASATVVSLSSNPPAGSIFDLSDHDVTTFGALEYNSYEAVYFAYNTDATQDDFRTAVEEFYAEVIAHNRAFIPSRVFDSWVDKVQTEFISGEDGGLKLPFLTSLSENKSEQVNVIGRIIALVADLIDTMQRVTATQAKQLDFLTQLQRQYTTLQSNIPIITVGQTGLGESIGQNADDDDKDAGRRQDINNFNQQIIEIVRGRKQIEENKAKQVQTLVNQANDATNQQSEIATTLLQQLSSLLQAIYR